MIRFQEAKDRAKLKLEHRVLNDKRYEYAANIEGKMEKVLILLEDISSINDTANEEALRSVYDDLESSLAIIRKTPVINFSLIKSTATDVLKKSRIAMRKAEADFAQSQIVRRTSTIFLLLFKIETTDNLRQND